MRMKMKMKIKIKIVLLIVGILPINLLQAQIGINTKDPKGIFHIDINGDTSTTNEQKDDFIVKDDGQTGVSSALGGTPVASASIALMDKNKALMPNRVALTDTRGTGDGINNPIKNPVDGMVLYCTNSAGIPPNNVTPGLYVFNSEKNRWLRIVNNSYSLKTNIYNLSEELPLPQISSYSTNTFLSSSNLMKLTPVGESNTIESIEIGSESAYAIALNLGGSIPNATASGSNTFSRMNVYVAVVLIDGNNNKKILDIAEICPLAFKGTNRKTTYSVVLGFNASPGDNIGIMICTLSSVPRWTLIPGITSITLWKV